MNKLKKGEDMLEKIIKKDKNEILENVLEQKEIDEKTKNLLQGILYKIEDSYKDYKTEKEKTKLPSHKST